MKCIRRWLGVFLTVIMLIGAVEIPVSAVDRSVSEGQENGPEQAESDTTEKRTEQKMQDIAEAPNRDGEANAGSKTQAEVDIQEGRIEYIFIDQKNLILPNQQNIVVALKDGKTAPETMTMHYYSGITGKEYTCESTKKLENVYLFGVSYAESRSDEIQIDYFSYQDEVQHIVVMDEETKQNAYYNVWPSDENGSMVNAYTIGDGGELERISGDEVSDVVEESLEKIETGNFSLGKSGDTTTTSLKKNIVVALDPGHDSHCGGTVSGSLVEAELTLKVANYCKEELENYSGVEVYMTRTTAACPNPQPNSYSSAADIRQRVQKAKAAGADVFVSFHFNSGGGNGAEIIYQNKSYSEELHLESKELAENILEQLVALGLRKHGEGIYYKDSTDGTVDPNGIKEDYFAVHNEAKAQGIAGIIIEHAFVDGSIDASLLKNESFLKKIGIADAKGIAETYHLVKAGTKPTASGIVIEKKNDFNGTFRVVVKNVQPIESVSKVLIPVWASENGQDDLVWYEAERDSQNNYIADIKVSNHKNQYGTYNVHVYFDDIWGNRSVYGGTTLTMKQSSVDVKITDAAGTQKTFQIATTVTNAPTELKGLKTAVWSKKDGQDDLKWYTGVKNGSIWSASVSISTHKTVGLYYADTYAVFQDGSELFLNSGMFTVTEPQIGKVEFRNIDHNKGTFDVVISQITAPAGVQKLQVPVWCKSDQSDLKWYDAVKQSNGTYKVTVNRSNHKQSTGIYTVHVYLTDGNGIVKAINAGTQELKIPEMKLQVGKKDSTEKVVDASISGVGTLANVNKVKFAVWSNIGGQDDLIWYNGEQDSTGAWKTSIVIANHKTSGLYYVDAYAVLSDGTAKYLKTGTFTISQPVIGKVTFEDINIDQGIFKVVIEGITAPSGVAKLQVPVWCAEDQSDLKWYTAEKEKGDVYSVTVAKSNHKDATGLYTIHVYLTDNNDIVTAINAGQKGVYISKTLLKIVTEKSGLKYTASLSGAGDVGSMKGIKFAVWSDKGGQDDLMWYEGVQDVTGAWECSIDIANHKTAGIYYVDAYAEMASGVDKYLKTGMFEVAGIGIKTVNSSTPDKNTGTFSVTISGVTAENLNKVQVVAWTRSNQSDKKIYDAQIQSNGNYTATVKPVCHNFSGGIYCVRAVVTNAAGIEEVKNGNSQTVPAVKPTSIMGESDVTTAELTALFKTHNGNYPTQIYKAGGAETIEEFCRLYVEEARAEGVKPEVAFSQAMLETGWLKFGGMVKVEQFNFCGLGAVDSSGGTSVATFPDIRTGIRAHIQHLKAYASNESLKNECVDPRFQMVTRGSALYVEYLGINENPRGSGWATADGYGYKILNLLYKL